MKSAIHAALKPVRARQQFLHALRLAALGLVLSGGIGLIVGFVRLVFDIEMATTLRVGLLAAGPIVGLRIGLFVRRSWHGAATAVDGHYGLKDRTVTALAFANDPSPTDLSNLQFADAMDHLRTVEPKAVAPLVKPRVWPLSVVAAMAASVVLALPIAQPNAKLDAAPTPEYITAMAQQQKAKLAILEKKPGRDDARHGGPKQQRREEGRAGASRKTA